MQPREYSINDLDYGALSHIFAHAILIYSKPNWLVMETETKVDFVQKKKLHCKYHTQPVNNMG